MVNLLKYGTILCIGLLCIGTPLRAMEDQGTPYQMKTLKQIFGLDDDHKKRAKLKGTNFDSLVELKNFLRAIKLSQAYEEAKSSSKEECPVKTDVWAIIRKEMLDKLNDNFQNELKETEINLIMNKIVFIEFRKQWDNNYQ